MFAAKGVDRDMAVDAQKPRFDSGLQDEIGVTVGSENVGNGACGAVFRLPIGRARVGFDEPAFLFGTTAKEILIVEAAFLAGRSNHGPSLMSEHKKSGAG